MRRPVRGLAALLLGGAWLAPATPARAAEPDPAALVARLEQAWKARDGEAYLALWGPAAPEARADERDFIQRELSSSETRIVIETPAAFPAGAQRLEVSAQVFSVNEPRAALNQWMFRLSKGPAGWFLSGRESQGRLDGLIHLALDPQGFRADGLAVHFEDFELTMDHGTLFIPPESVGPTVLVFVGEGTLRFSPQPEAEREQLRQFSGRPQLVDRVSAAFIRLHPADLHRVLAPVRFEADPRAAERLEAAQRLYRVQSAQSFVLDASLPGSPWWILPGVGDALATVDTDHHGTLTYALNTSEPESISFFDRRRRRQICLYPSGGRSTRYNEDDRRPVDTLHHDLRLRFEPGRGALAGEDTLRIRLLQPALTLQLHLDEHLAVESVTSPQGGQHLFFRVRHQDALMVSLGPLAGTLGEVALTIRYGGTLEPGDVEQEVTEGLQTGPQRGFPSFQEEVHIENVRVYSNRYAWYPQTGSDDHATASLRFDVPEGYNAVTGGVRTGSRLEGERNLVEYKQEQPGKYISVAVGRLAEAGTRQEGPVTLRIFGDGHTRSDADQTLARAADILRFYSEELGPCPYSAVNLVVIEAPTPGGHSPPGMVVLARRPLQMRGALREDPGGVSDVPGFFLAHELAHQWWGQGVSGQNYHERWLSEGAAQYAAVLWLRHSRGEEEFRETLKRMAKWALKTSQNGPISLGFRLGQIKEDPQIFRAIVYDKGAYVLHMLRGIVGDEPFRRGLQALQSGHRYAKVGTDDLREALEAASSLDLSAYFREWVFGTALPRLRLSQRTEAGPAGARLIVSVAAEHVPGPVPLEIAVVDDRERKTTRVTLEPQGGSWTLDVPKAPRKVEINGDQGLLAVIGKP